MFVQTKRYQFGLITLVTLQALNRGIFLKKHAIIIAKKKLKNSLSISLSHGFFITLTGKTAQIQFKRLLENKT